MKYSDRVSLILAELDQKASVSVEELSQKLQVSAVTIRKDLNQMDRSGLIVRTFGGATVCKIDGDRRDRMLLLQTIARCAAEQIHNDDTVIMNAGTTTLLTARHLLQNEAAMLKVITNSIPIGVELSLHKNFQVVLLGGELNSSGIFTSGNDAVRQLGQYKAKKVILSVDGVSMKSGLTTKHSGLQFLFQKMIDRAFETIVVADSSKIGFQGFCHVCPLQVVDKLITNRSDETEDELARFEDMGIEVIRCD